MSFKLKRGGCTNKMSSLMTSRREGAVDGFVCVCVCVCPPCEACDAVLRPVSHSHPSSTQSNDSLNLPHNLVYCVGKILDVARVKPGHADATVLGHVDMIILPQLGNLLL